jgi:hypothetical protein
MIGPITESFTDNNLGVQIAFQELMAWLDNMNFSTTKLDGKIADSVEILGNVSGAAATLKYAVTATNQFVTSGKSLTEGGHG